MLVASSIYDACKYYTLLEKTAFKGRCAVITSYDPQTKDVSKEELEANTCGLPLLNSCVHEHENQPGEKPWKFACKP